MPDRQPPARIARIDLPVDGADDLAVLRAALLAARATELAEVRRRDLRLSAGYGTDSAREGMGAEVDRHGRRMELLDRLIVALDLGLEDEQQIRG
jgi:hypothetical protein